MEIRSKKRAARRSADGPLPRPKRCAEARRRDSQISSCSCCTDFQARRANIKYRDPANFKGSRFVYRLREGAVFERPPLPLRTSRPPSPGQPLRVHPERVGPGRGPHYGRRHRELPESRRYHRRRTDEQNDNDNYGHHRHPHRMAAFARRRTSSRTTRIPTVPSRCPRCSFPIWAARR